jgi:hypothetical protein
MVPSNVPPWRSRTGVKKKVKSAGPAMPPRAKETKMAVNVNHQSLFGSCGGLWIFT